MENTCNVEGCSYRPFEEPLFLHILKLIKHIWDLGVNEKRASEIYNFNSSLQLLYSKLF